MLTLEALTPHLRLHGLDPSIRHVYNRIPESTDNQIIVIADVPGMPTEMQDAIDNPAVQIITRSQPQQAQQARNLSHTIDRIMLNDKLRPFYLNGALVLGVGRLGSAPTYLDTDEQNRTLYTCTYWIHIER